ncbi:hypothetical protein M885DRAFT_506786 [Pelagophyceae sp. CCMP2097]|nr:hypothetical protein M885DRAFT_506786 [Pelagophyceae sp. CCMP2097]
MGAGASADAGTAPPSKPQVGSGAAGTPSRGKLMSEANAAKLPSWFRLALASEVPKARTTDEWLAIEGVFDGLATGDTEGLGDRNLSSKARVVAVEGFHKTAAELNQRGLDAPSLLNYDAWCGALPPDDLSKRPGYHPYYAAQQQSPSIDFESKVLFSMNDVRCASLSLELPQEALVQEVGWTFTPWDRNNCTAFRVTTKDGGGNATSWDAVDVPRTTAAQVVRSIQTKTGFDVTPAIGLIEPAVRASRDVYRAALGKMLKGGGGAVARVRDMASYTVPTDPGALLQPTNDLEALYEDAAHAQRAIKALVAPGTAWARTEIDEAWKVAYNTEHGAGAHRDFRAIKATEGVVAGLQTVVDPGLKSRERATAKASYKYLAEDGRTVLWKRLRDISRFALEFDTAEALLKGVGTVQQTFDVVQCENRFRQPTPLGWSDISFLLRVKVPTSREYHVAELQLYLRDFAQARDLAHTHYETIRTTLPTQCRIPMDKLDEVQYIINEELVQGRQVHRGGGEKGFEYMSTTMARMPGRPVPTKTVDIVFEGAGNHGYGGQRICFLHILGPIAA